MLEPSEEELNMQAEPVTDEGQDPVYFAEPGKPPSKIPLRSYYFTKHDFFFKNKIMHVLFFLSDTLSPKNYFQKKMLSGL